MPEGTDHDGSYLVSAHQVTILGRPPIPPPDSDPSIITLLATGMGTDGLVNARGSQGVRITTGPPLLPPTCSDSTNGFEVVAGETQNVTIQRGLLPGIDQQIEM